MRVYRTLLGLSLLSAGLAWIAASWMSVQTVGTFILAGDYLSYVAAGQRVLDGTGIYAPFQLAGPYPLGRAAWGMGYVYPPPTAVLAVPFAWIGEPLGFAVFTTAAGMTLGLALYRVARGEGLGPGHARLFALVLLVSPPAIESLGTGQANTFVAIGLLGTWLYPRASGYLAVIGGVLKLFPLSAITWTIRTRAPVMWPLAMLVAVLALSVLLQGTDAWRDFFVASSNGQSTQFLPPTPPRQLLQPVVGPFVAFLLSLAVTGAVLILVICVRSPYLAFALLSVAMILPAPDWYVHYLVIPLAGVAPWFARQAAVRLRAPDAGTPRREGLTGP